MSRPVALASCLCFLVLQWSGLHVHANEAGYIGGPETPFTHRHARHDDHDAHHVGDGDHDHGAPASPGADHDYGDARDVSLSDQGFLAAKSPLAILALILVFLFAICPLIRALTSAEIVYPVLSGRYTRWRPPLRAPPRYA